jgi:glycosyltransferase involved in cell wall biosynthesis
MPGKRLLVVGEGQQSAKLRKLAGRNVTFSGYLARPDYVDAIANAKAMVYAGCEDFGIALAEAQACGTPLIAYGRGGACDIVQSLGATEAPTGVLFADQTVAAIREAVETFERHIDAISPLACQRNAWRFNSARFDREIASALVMAQAMNADRMALPPRSTGYPAP